MNLPSDLKYTKDHEWVRVDEDGITTIGITDFAQNELGDIVFVDIDTEGKSLEANEPFGTIEAVKTVSDLFMPVAARVEKVNPDLEDNPELVNTDPYNKGWIAKVTLADTKDIEGLMDAAAYEKLVQS